MRFTVENLDVMQLIMKYDIVPLTLSVKSTITYAFL